MRRLWDWLVRLVVLDWGTWVVARVPSRYQEAARVSEATELLMQGVERYPREDRLARLLLVFMQLYLRLQWAKLNGQHAVAGHWADRLTDALLLVRPVILQDIPVTSAVDDAP
jgi:hypothetical protein